jgi:hypothetical protein
LLTKLETLQAAPDRVASSHEEIKEVDILAQLNHREEILISANGTLLLKTIEEWQCGSA